MSYFKNPLKEACFCVLIADMKARYVILGADLIRRCVLDYQVHRQICD